MNFIKKHLLQKELLSLESKITRYYALSSWKLELESNQGNIIQKLFNRYFLSRCNIEYDSLRDKVPSFESKIYEIKSMLRDY